MLPVHVGRVFGALFPQLEDFVFVLCQLQARVVFFQLRQHAIFERRVESFAPLFGVRVARGRQPTAARAAEAAAAYDAAALFGKDMERKIEK